MVGDLDSAAYLRGMFCEGKWEEEEKEEQTKRTRKSFPLSAYMGSGWGRDAAGVG